MTNPPIDLEARVRHFYEEVFKKHNLDIFEELVHPDYHSHTQGNEATRDSAKEWFGRIIAKFPYIEGGPQDVVAQGNTVALRQEYVLRATPDAEPTIVRTMDFYKTDKDGLLKDHWDILDLVQGDLPD